MHVLMAAAEMAPYCKTGGLADVLGALPVHLARAGIQVQAVLPFYTACGSRPVIPFGECCIPMEGKREERIHFLRVAEVGEPGVQVFFVDHPSFRNGRIGLYGDTGGPYPDNAWRYTLFAKSVLALADRLSEPPSLLHAHDWHCGLVPFFNALSPSPYPCVFTLHNLGYQGNFPAADIAALGAEAKAHFHLDGLEFFGQLSLLKAGIAYADQLTTVSPTYAKEILTAEFGLGMEGLLLRRRERLHGILNGVDYEIWDPEHDPILPYRYTADDLSGKKRCKEELCRRLKLDTTGNPPVAGMISRLVEEKGLPLVVAAAENLLRNGLRLVILGSGAPKWEKALLRLAANWPRKMAICLAFDEDLAHNIEAGADLFLMPSRYEACGLNQIYSLRYGTIPVVRATGGLADTISDPRQVAEEANGFTFSPYTAEALEDAVMRALAVYQHPTEWQNMQRRGMAMDFSWPRAVENYIRVYHRAVQDRH